jgi:hypothetical protein
MQEVEGEERHMFSWDPIKDQNVNQKNAKFDNIFEPYLERWRMDKDAKAAREDLLDLCSWVFTEANLTNSATPASWDHAFNRVSNLLGELKDIKLSEQFIYTIGNGLNPRSLSRLKELPHVHGWTSLEKT